MSGVVRLALLLTVVASAPASAQWQTRFDVGAGMTSADGTGAGTVAQLGFEVRPASAPVSLRVDGSYHQWFAHAAIEDAAFRASAVTVSAVYRLPAERVRPYILAGAGAYALRSEGAVTGWNLGGGIEVPRGRVSVFGEVRGHFVSSEFRQRLTPILLGIRF